MADYDVAGALHRIENELIASMMRNLERHTAEEDDLEINWEQWQVRQLKALDDYKKRNRKIYGTQFKDINRQIENLIEMQRETGNGEQEIKILNAIKNGAALKKATGRAAEASAAFFRTNDRRLNALIDATTNDLQKAEHAMLRMADDKYRKIIFDAQFYAASGAGTYEKAIDMATKDFLRAGINCIEYKNGARHTAADYAEMAIRTAGKRSQLMGEGEMRNEYGIHTVIMNKRGNPCPKCLPFVGKVLIDDVWSGGSAKDGKYPLMSSAIAAGLYHPRCKDGHTTYFPDIDEEPDDKFTKQEIQDIEEQNRKEAKQQYAKRKMESFDRLARYSLDNDNKKMYEVRRDEWKKVAELAQTDIMKAENNAKAIDSMQIDVSDEVAHYTREQILQEMQKSQVGKKTINHIANSNVLIEMINEKQIHTNRGEQRGNKIRIYLQNIKSERVGAQTVIHEMTHFYYQIGNCQHAEAVCFAMEKMHLLNRDYLTEEEWNQMVKLAVDNYPEYEWEDGGYGNFNQFNFVRGNAE